MKRIILILVAILSLTTYSHAAKFTIKKLNTPFIEINGKQCKVGDTFKDTDKITMSSDRQVMYVVGKKSQVYVIKGKKYRESKAKKFKDFFTPTVSTTVRNMAEGIIISKEDHKDALQRDFVLMDTLKITVGWPTTAKAHYEAVHTDNQGHVSRMTIPVENAKTLLFTDEFYRQLTGGEPDSAVISIRYVEPSRGDTTLITDRMLIEKFPVTLP